MNHSPSEWFSGYKKAPQNTLRSLFSCFLRLVDHGDGAGHAAGTVGVVDIVVARRGDKLLIRVERELTVIIYALIVAILIIFVL